MMRSTSGITAYALSTVSYGINLEETKQKIKLIKQYKGDKVSSHP